MNKRRPLLSADRGAVCRSVSPRFRCVGPGGQRSCSHQQPFPAHRLPSSHCRGSCHPAVQPQPRRLAAAACGVTRGGAAPVGRARFTRSARGAADARATEPVAPLTPMADGVRHDSRGRRGAARPPAAPLATTRKRGLIGITHPIDGDTPGGGTAAAGGRAAGRGAGSTMPAICKAPLLWLCVSSAGCPRWPRTGEWVGC